MTLADDIKRLREVELSVFPIERAEAMRTINALVELVGEMREALEYGKRYSAQGFPALLTMPAIDTQREFNQKADVAYDKAAPIAALAKGE